MRSLRLKNFRSLVDTGPIELRPLTVLVGANSSGKSSFLRFFPLLRQTYEERSASPLLWYGRDVDFGDFSQVARRGASPKLMEVEWEQDLDPPEAKHWLMRLPWKQRLRVQSSSRLTDLHGGTQMSSYALGWDGMVLRLDADGSPGLTKLSATSPSEFVFSLPDIDAANALVPILEAKATYEWRPPRLFPCVGPLKSLLGEMLRGKVASETIDELVDDLPIATQDKWLDAVSDLHGGRALAKALRSGKSGQDFFMVRLYTLASLLPVILETLRESLARFAARVVYLRPVRAEPRRYYRVQELSVAHMDPHGENLAMFLQ